MPVGTKRFKLGDTTIALTVLATQEDKARGFMGATEPPLDSAGLLFMNPSKSFWMKNVPFNLDLIGFDDSNRVVEILDLQAGNTNPVTFSAPNLKTAVEVRAGWAADHNLELGSELTPEGSRTFMVIENNSRWEKGLAELEDLSKTVPDPKKRTALAFLTAKINFGEPIGMGAGRVVFGIDDKRVLKVLREYRPNNQNQMEVKTYECLGPELAAQVLVHTDPDGVWIVSERLRDNAEEVKEWFINLAYKALGPVAVERRYKAERNSNGINAMIHAVTGEHQDTQDKLAAVAPWIGDLSVKVFTCDVEAADFHSKNWGFRDGLDHPVLLDYGFISHSGGGGFKLESLIYENTAGWDSLSKEEKQEALGIFQDVIWKADKFPEKNIDQITQLFKTVWATSPEGRKFLPKLLMDFFNRDWTSVSPAKLLQVKTLEDFRVMVNSTPRERDPELLFHWSDGDDFELSNRNYPRVEVKRRLGMGNEAYNLFIMNPAGNAGIGFKANGQVSGITVDGEEAEPEEVESLLSDGTEEGLMRAVNQFGIKLPSMMTEHQSRGFLKSLLF